MTDWKQNGWRLVLVVMAGLWSVANAELLQLESPDQALSDTELETLRGGFVFENLEIAIGLEQVLSVNGEILAVSRLTIPDLNQLSNGLTLTSQVETLLADTDFGSVNMPVVTSELLDGGVLTVIQNNLNGAVIQNASELTIELNNLGAGYRLPDAMREPVLQYLRQ